MNPAVTDAPILQVLLDAFPAPVDPTHDTAAAVVRSLRKFLGAGMIAFALIRWEIGSLEDETDLLTTSRSR
jgi:hypothetical protein